MTFILWDNVLGMRYGMNSWSQYRGACFMCSSLNGANGGGRWDVRYSDGSRISGDEMMLLLEES